VGDIDGDGLPDVIAAGAKAEGDGLYWYRYPGWSKHEIVEPGVTGFTTDMQVGDVDGDGDLDIIVPQGINVGGSVWWYENPRPDGDPAEDEWVEHSVGTATAHDVEVGDINGDGRLDVVVRAGDTTLFLQGEGETWTRAVVSTRPDEGLALGDLDGDGHSDIVLGTHWLENPLPGGDPAEDEWTEYPIDPERIDPDREPQFSVHLTDLDGDGRLDVICGESESEGYLSWYRGPANPQAGPWVEHVVDEGPDYMHGITTADVDLDGKPDLLSAEMNRPADPPYEVSVYFNDGDGLAWTKHVMATTGSHNIRVTDIGNDGDMDIVGANWFGDAPLEMWRNDLFASWERHVIDRDKPWTSTFVRMGDLDGDGHTDIATGGWWYRNPGTPGEVWTRRAFGDPMNNVAILHDFDGDGDLDVFGTQGDRELDNHELAWAQNDGSGEFTVHTNIESGDGGGFLQGVAVHEPTSGGPTGLALSWHEHGSDLELVEVPVQPVADHWPWSAISSVSEGEALSSADLNDDGAPDLMLGPTWLRNDGGSWSEHAVATNFPDPDRHELVDLNGDGRLDVVLGEEAVPETGRVSWFAQPEDPSRQWTEHVISDSLMGGGMSLDVGDMDLDGDPDVVVGEHHHSSSREPELRVVILENADGLGGSWREDVVYQGDEHHVGTRLVDIEDDGDLDIVSIGWTHDRVLLYENPARP
jgi:hypothetical protein